MSGIYAMAIMTLKSRRVKRPSAMLMKPSSGDSGGGGCSGKYNVVGVGMR